MKNHIVLNTGDKMPILGLGTWKAPKDAVGAAVEYALNDAGYRHIDCAAIYLNEKEIGEALQRVFKNGEVKRKDVFITSKLWNTEHAKKDVMKACKQTLKDLQLDYLDLYLMHWGIAGQPVPEPKLPNARGEAFTKDKKTLLTQKIPIAETWEAMEELVKAGLVRNIGVANFTTMLLQDLMALGRTVPAMNQIELHPYNQQDNLIKYCKNRDIAVTAYAPLGTPANVKRWDAGQPILLNDKMIKQIAKGHKKTPAQVLIKWAIQRGTVVIPKSVTPERIKENIQVFDFLLTKGEMERMAKLERRLRLFDTWNWWRIPYFD